MDAVNTPVKFDVYAGDQLVRTEILSEATIKVGKLPSSHLRLDDDSVSMVHAVVSVKPGGQVTVLDLSSANGTYVNGQRVTEQPLRTGDEVVFGGVRVRVAIAGQQQAQAGAAPMAQRAAPAAPPPPTFDTEDLGYGQTLEVMALWGATVVDVQHINEGAYLIGPSESSNQYVDPNWVGQGDYPLALNQAGDMIINVPSAVSGEVLLEGRVFSLAELASAGKLGKSSLPNSRSLRLPQNARCRLEFGSVTFLVNSVPAPPPVGRGGILDLFGGGALLYMLAAAMLHGLFFLIVMSIPEDADSLRLDGFDMSNRFVEFLLTPEVEKPEEVPDLFKGLKDEEAGQAAEKAKGDEGKLGKTDSQEKDNRFAVEGPADNESIQLAKERAKETALRTADAAFNQLEGELSAVWGSGDRAVGSDAVSALGNMFGDKIGEAQGFGGLGTAGVGRGGGGFGEASIGVGAVGTRGRGGAGSGGGSNYGRGVGRLGDREARKPKVVPGKPIVTGALDMETIRRIIRQHQNEYRFCYERELNRKRDLNGKIVMKFTIAGNGSVIAAGVEETTMKSPAVENCIAQRIRRWVFPAPKGGGIVVVKYPFIFKPS